MYFKNIFLINIEILIPINIKINNLVLVKDYFLIQIKFNIFVDKIVF